MFRLVVASVFIMIATESVAEDTAYLCDFKARERGWISPQIAIGHNTESDEVFINDNVIHHFVGAPVQGKIVADTDKKKTFTWSIHTKTGSQQAKMDYRAAIFLQKNKASVTAKPHGYGNNFTARGSCKRTDPKSVKLK